MITRSTHPKGRALLALFALLFGFALTLGLTPGVALADEAQDGSDAPQPIVILHTTDIHAKGLTASDSAVGFDGIAGAKAALEERYGEGNVVLVDAGDTIQGSALGAFSEGEDIVELMKASGYDLAVPGNHDFDYGIEQLRSLNELAQVEGEGDYATSVASTFSYVASNVTNMNTQESLFDGYKLFEFGDVSVAFVGAVTPETPSKENPSIFQEDGQLAWDFHSSDLAARVQEDVDEAKAAGADYVIAVMHHGSGGSLASAIRGLDAVIDGHSHAVVNGTARNGDGQQIRIAQSGQYFRPTARW